MNKDDLKNGMLVKIRGDEYAMVLLNTQYCGSVLSCLLLKSGCYLDLKNYSEDLINEYSNECDVMRVFSGYVGDAYRSLRESALYGVKEIWKRDETHKITIDGKEIEISEESFNNLKKQLCE